MRRFALVCLCLLSSSTLTSPAAGQEVLGDIHVGYDRLSDDDDTLEGVSYGLSVAVQARRGSSTVGVQADIDATDNSQCERDILVIGDRACLSAERDLALSLRLGSYVARGTSLYVTAGYANARVAVDYTLSGVRAAEGEALNGVRVGAGVATELSRRFFGKAEVRYTNYEDDVSRAQALVGIGLRF